MSTQQLLLSLPLLRAALLPLPLPPPPLPLLLLLLLLLLFLLLRAQRRIGRQSMIICSGCFNSEGSAGCGNQVTDLCVSSSNGSGGRSSKRLGDRCHGWR